MVRDFAFLMLYIFQEVGCDGKFEGSEAIEDQCGNCNGDGTMCKLVEGTDSTGFQGLIVAMISLVVCDISDVLGYRMVAVVPIGAKKVKIEETEPNSNILALGLPDNKTVEFNARL